MSNRLPVMERAREYFSGLLTSGSRPQTVRTQIADFTRFLDWADQTFEADSLLDAAHAKHAFARYVEYLRHRLMTGHQSLNSAATRQNVVLKVLGELMGDEDIAREVNLIRIRKSSTQNTEPPDEGMQARVLGLCKSLFEGLSTLCLEFKPYPYSLAVPASLSAPENRLWVFPSLRWCMPPHTLNKRDSIKRATWVYDYVAGRVAEVADIAHRYNVDPKKNTPGQVAEVGIQHAKRSIAAANEDPQNSHRRNAALLAHNSFMLLFIANTAMNWASVRTLPWSSHFDLGSERQGFRTVKCRAGGRVVSFEIQAVFLPAFRKFLRLRAYLLGDSPFDRLFLASGRGVKNVRPLAAKGLTSVFDALRRIDPECPDIKSKRWRAAKSDWLLRKTDPSTTAAILQNSEATVLASYAAGSAGCQAEEFAAFFNSLASAVLDRGVFVPAATDTAVGLCQSFQNPHQSQPAAVKSDCKTPEGCLSCDKHKAHADERDTRKLLSCQYCIEQTAHLARNEEQFQSLFGGTLGRIRELLEEIDRREPGIVQRVRAEVESGELDPYWEGRLQLLIELELVD